MKKHTTGSHPGFVITLGEDALEAGKPIRILPIGQWFDPRYGKFEITRRYLETLIANAVKNGNDIPFDFDHRSEKKDASEEDKESRGWLSPKTLQIIDGWLQGVPRWGERAVEAIQKRTRKYISPAFQDSYPSKTGEGEDQGPTLSSIALLARPFLPGQAEGVALSEADSWVIRERDGHMFKLGEKARKILGLGEDADQDAIEAKIVLLGSDDDKGDKDDKDEKLSVGVMKMLSEKGLKDGDDPVVFIKTLETPKKDGETPAMKELRESNASMVKRLEAADRREALRDAEVKVAKFSDPKDSDNYKIVPAMKESMRKLAEDSPDQFDQVIESMPSQAHLLSEIGTSGGPEEGDQYEKAGEQMAKFANATSDDE